METIYGDGQPLLNMNNDFKIDFIVWKRLSTRRLKTL